MTWAEASEALEARRGSPRGLTYGKGDCRLDAGIRSVNGELGDFAELLEAMPDGIAVVRGQRVSESPEQAGGRRMNQRQ